MNDRLPTHFQILLLISSRRRRRHHHHKRWVQLAVGTTVLLITNGRSVVDKAGTSRPGIGSCSWSLIADEARGSRKEQHGPLIVPEVGTVEPQPEDPLLASSATVSSLVSCVLLFRLAGCLSLWLALLQ